MCLCLSAGAGRRQQGSTKAGRRRGQHNSAAVSRCHEQMNASTHADHTCYSQHQLFYKGSCQPGTKHVVFRGVRSANHSSTALNCRVCAKQGSAWERVLYALCDAEPLILEYATEAFVLNKHDRPVTNMGVTVCPEKKAWDVVLAAPSGLLIEMHGEGHISRLLTKANNTDNSMAIRQLKDELYAQAAMAQGKSLLWLCVDEGIKSRKAQRARWAAQLAKAVCRVRGGGTPQLFIA